MNHQIITYLKNTTSITLSYAIYLNRDHSFIQITLSRKRAFIPVLPHKLQQELHGLFSIWRITVTPSSKYTHKNMKYLPLYLTSDLPSLNSLVYALTPLSTTSQINVEVQHSSKFSFAMWIGYDKSFSVNTIKAILRGSTKDIKFAKQRKDEVEDYELFKILKLPELPNLGYGHSQSSIVHKYKFSFEHVVGTLINQNIPIGVYGFSKTDFLRGGIIVGAIGTGKTNLRLQIMQYLQNKNVRIVDFDLKGDAARYSKFVGKRIIPKLNFHFNIFSVPSNLTPKDYAAVLYRTFLETLPEPLPPAQKSILYDALTRTLNVNGSALDFIENLLFVSIAAKQRVDNLQESSAYALITKFSWLFTVLHDIFWVDESSLTDKDYEHESLFFDFSQLFSDVSITYIKLLLDLILIRILSTYSSAETTQVSQLVIFIDEAQLLMPKHPTTNLTRLEEVVTTLRYRGISVIAAGVSAELMSPVLSDTGFLAQFRSESTALQRAFGLNGTQQSVITDLPDFHCLVRSKSTRQTTVQAHINPFGFQQTSLANYLLQYPRIPHKFLNNITLTPDYHKLVEFKVMCQINITVSQFQFEFQKANNFLHRQWDYLNHDLERKDIECIFHTFVANSDNYLEFAVLCIALLIRLYITRTHKWLVAQNFIITMRQMYNSPMLTH